MDFKRIFQTGKSAKIRVNRYSVHSSQCVQGNTSIDCDDVVNDWTWWIQILSAFILSEYFCCRSESH